MEVAGTTLSPAEIVSRQDIGIAPGDTVRVWQKVEEKGKTRLQPFEGFVLARKHGSEPGATFTVRRVNDPYGVEKIFPLYAPSIGKIEIVKRATVRRAKLYHIRKQAAREIKRQMRNLRFVSLTTGTEGATAEAAPTTEREPATSSEFGDETLEAEEKKE